MAAQSVAPRASYLDMATRTLRSALGKCGIVTVHTAPAKNSDLTHLCLMYRWREGTPVTAKQQALLGTFAIIAFLSLSLLLTLTFYRQSVPRTSRPNMVGGLPASNSVILPTVTTFAYRVSHTPLPFPGNYLRSTPANDDIKRFSSADLEHVRPREFSRLALCSFAAAVARSNNIPVPFFANLIWQESSFNVKVISRAGAQGIAQFMPRTAVEFDLLNPFDPIHALSTSGNLCGNFTVILAISVWPRPPTTLAPSG